jgi:shikimate dehydrogenase
LCQIVSGRNRGSGIQLFQRVERSFHDVVCPDSALAELRARGVIGCRACVGGWPVSHSRSPLIRGLRDGIDGSCTGPQPREGGPVLGSLRAEGYVGCNVTIPHKETACAVAAEVRPAARAAGAANTLWYEGDRLVADNTDGAGFIHNLGDAVPRFDIRGAIVSVLGAGGAARGIVFALLEAGAGEIRIFNRTSARADAVAEDFGARVKGLAWDRRNSALRNVSLLVNTTPLGMPGSDPLSIDIGALDPTCVVADIVYVPIVTPLLAAARARGLATVDGLGMLLHQAVPGFERWFGVRPQVTEELRALVGRDIEGA